jgi:hypothetical protein
LKDGIPPTVAVGKFGMETQSYFLIKDGDVTVINGIYSRLDIPAKPSIPAAVILKIINEKIENETWYYDRTINI